MELSDRVLELVRIGSTPAEVVSELGIRRDQYYTALDELTVDGVLAEFGRLPEGAVTETCPPQEAVDLIAVAAANSAWSQRGTASVRTLCSRYGWTLPGTDRRYSRTQWTGHAVRRVDLDGFMVVGFILPRRDNQRWHRAAPRHRVVYVESVEGGEHYSGWLAERGRPVVHDDIDASVIRPLSLDELVSLTLAVAWVCEARAILPEKRTSPRDLTYDDAYGRCACNVTEGNCPACGDPIAHCRGHDGIDDPDGFAVLEAHELGDHTGCVHSI